MKAAVYFRYGPPEVVQIADIEKPVPKDDEVLIKVRAAGVNPLDWRLMRGGPYIMRKLLELGKAKIKRPGVDVAGQVEAAGSKVTQFKPGDAVYGLCKGAFAEYLCAPQSALVIKPDGLTFEQAAAAPVAALTALQGLRDRGHIQPGQKILINGAAGGVGTFAVQIAKSFGAQVTGVCSTRNLDLVRSIGADQVVDYTREDFTRASPTTGKGYDIILECVGNLSLTACRRVLNPKGICVIAGAKGLWSVLAVVLKAPVLSRLVSQKFVFFIAKLKLPDLTTLSELMTSGRVTPVIDRHFSLQQVPDAIRYLETGHARGKVVITF